jgi:predicted nucleic acid-binding protein
VSDFFDTNVLLYADDASAGPKRFTSRELIHTAMSTRTGVLSTQVLQEFYVNARKKLKLDGPAARARVEVYSTFDVVTVTPTLILAAVDLHRLDSISFWDALIIRAAEQAGCDTLYSEDLQTGRRFGPVRVVNPFS